MTANALGCAGASDPHVPPALPPTNESRGGNDPSVYGAREIPYGAVGKERRCQLATCATVFLQRNTSGEARFCSKAHKDEYWRQAAKIGDRVLSGQMVVSGKSQTSSILEILREYAKWGWVDHCHQRLPFVLWGTRCSELRHRGHDVRCRRVFCDAHQRIEYQYRLYEKEAGK